MIVGDSGSGNTTWCKHLDQCWSQHSEMDDAGLKCLNLPKLIQFKIVLYLSLKSSDQGLSLQRLLQKSLFPKQSAHLEVVMKYMHEQNHSQSILIVIDGLDKIGENANSKLVSELLDNELLSSCTFIFTSRPSSFKSIFVQSIRSFQVCAMKSEKSKEYVRKVLMTITCQNNKVFDVENFWMFTKVFHVKCLLRLPYLCLNLLFVWMEKKMDKENCSFEITDILLQIINNLLERAMTDEMCQEKIKKLQQGNTYDEEIHIEKLSDQRFKDLLIVASRIAHGIFLSEMNITADEERQILESSGSAKDTLEVMYEIGLMTKSFSVESNENLSKRAFTNMLFYHFFVSIAIALKNIVSDTNVAQRNSTIHMLCQFLPTSGNDIFKKIGKLNNRKGERHEEQNKKYSIKCKEKRRLATGGLTLRPTTVWWLQSLMYTGELDNEKLLFLTNALKFTESLTILVLENRENQKKLIFWLPFAESLKTLTLNINNCILLLCQEWNNQSHLNLQEITIESVIIYSDTLAVLNKAVEHSKKPKTKISPADIRFGLNKILSPGSDNTK